MTARHRIIDSPIGPLTLVGEGDVLTGLYFPGHWTRPDTSVWGPADDTSLTTAARQLGEYFAGERTAFALRLHLRGTAFQRAVWTRLAAIPHGTTTTYRELAVALGRPGHARAVGAAVRTNPISVIVPCHRVLGSSGALTGYAGGLERKAFLLAHEGSHADRDGIPNEILCNDAH
jgi:methylated-DNA-[protein]-cysteine S-methyltransferase